MIDNEDMIDNIKKALRRTLECNSVPMCRKH